MAWRGGVLGVGGTSRNGRTHLGRVAKSEGLVGGALGDPVFEGLLEKVHSVWLNNGVPMVSLSLGPDYATSHDKGDSADGIE